jgi:hypothetical protein
MATITTNFKFPTKEQVEKFEIYHERLTEEEAIEAENSIYYKEDVVQCERLLAEKCLKRQRILNILKNQQEFGKLITKTFDKPILVDINTNKIVTESIVNGKFEKTWIIKNGNEVKFLSIAKNESTYEKHGLKLITKRFTYEYGGYFKKCVNTDHFRIVSSIKNVEIINEAPKKQATEMPLELWVAYKETLKK